MFAPNDTNMEQSFADDSHGAGCNGDGNHQNIDATHNRMDAGASMASTQTDLSNLKVTVGIDEDLQMILEMDPSIVDLVRPIIPLCLKFIIRFSFLLFCKKKVPNRSVYCHWLSVWIPNEFANLICYRLFIVSCIVYKGGRYYRLYTGNNNKQFTMPYTQSVWFTTDSWRVSTATLEQRTFFGVHFTLLRITQRTTETDIEIVLLFIAFMSKILHLSHLDHKTIRCWQQLVEQKYAFEWFGKLVNSNNKSSTSPQSCCKRRKSSNIRLKFMKCDQKWLILAHTFDGRARTRP